MESETQIENAFIEIPEDCVLNTYKGYYTQDLTTGVVYIPFILTEGLLSTGALSEIKQKLELLKYNIQ